jgi:hypothetical protein
MIFRIMQGKPGIFRRTNDFHNKGPGAQAGEMLIVGANRGFTLMRESGMNAWRLWVEEGADAQILAEAIREVDWNVGHGGAEKTVEAENSPAPKGVTGEDQA